ncbi:MAG: hypothetical protein CMK43_11575 [Porticoccaceae bacterium]|nr:hypothetical protein [Porticoccaceae bacterium]
MSLELDCCACPSSLFMIKIIKDILFAESNGELFAVLDRLGQFTVWPERVKLTSDQKRSRFPLKKKSVSIYPLVKGSEHFIFYLLLRCARGPAYSKKE